MPCSCNKSRPRNESGAVLILVLVCLLAMSSMVMTSARRAFDDLGRTQRLADEFRTDLVVELALNAAMAKIIEDTKLNSDTLGDPWRAKITGDNYTVSITPCNSRFNLNFINEGDRYKQAVDTLLRKKNLSRQGANYLADWVDEDHKDTVGGGEGGAYSETFPHYGPRNGELKTPEEAQLIAGWNDADREWIFDTFTTWGDTIKFNINYIPYEIFAAIMPELKDDWGSVDSWRVKTGFESIDQLRRAIDRLSTDDALYAEAINVFSVKSHFFRIIIEVQLPFVYEKRRYIVERNPFRPTQKPEILHGDTLKVVPASGN